MRAIFAGLIVLGCLAAACGEDDGIGGGGTASSGTDILHLRGYDVTADNLRLAIRGLFIGPDSPLCANIRGLSASAAVDAFNQWLESGLPTNVPIPNVTPVSDQARRSREDEERAAQIAIDECASASPSATTQGASSLSARGPSIGVRVY